MTQNQITVDQEVYSALKGRAEAFVDTPNSVLRRLLGLDKEQKTPSRKSGEVGASPRPATDQDSKRFVDSILAREFGRGFHRKDRFSYMFEDQKTLVYFQNFNMAGDRAWYRVSESAQKAIKGSNKRVFLCFTIPADGEYYLIPYADVLSQMSRIEWIRQDIEVNIDRSRAYWTDLRWHIGKYQKRMGQSG